MLYAMKEFIWTTYRYTTTSATAVSNVMASTPTEYIAHLSLLRYGTVSSRSTKHVLSHGLVTLPACLAVYEAGAYSWKGFDSKVTVCFFLTLGVVKLHCTLKFE